MHRTGKYKMLNLTFGFFPFIAAMLITTMNEHSSDARLWLSIVNMSVTQQFILLNVTDRRFLWDSGML
jgi:hypothetical protein